MKALILAAGIGSRIKEMSSTYPKSMISVNGISIIENQINSLLDNNINEIIIVVGYKSKELIDFLNIKYLNTSLNFVINQQYNTTNNMYSAYLAKDHFNDSSFLLLNADVYFESSLISSLLKSKYPNSILVDNKVFNEESMKVSLLNNKINRISKDISSVKSFGVSADIYKFSSYGGSKLFESIRHHVENNQSLNLWTEVALNNILNEVDFYPCLIKGRWVEIDTLEDYKMAVKMFS